MDKILVVDDCQDAVEYYILLMEEISSQVVFDTAYSGEEGFLKFQNKSYDLIISDYRMPGLDGYSLLRKIRAIDRDVPYILISGVAAEVPLDLQIDRASLVLEKPVEQDDFLRFVKHLLNISSLSKTILIVDDSRTARFVMQTVLSKSGYKVLEADCGEEALIRIDQNANIDLIISDFEMPTMNGVELADKIASIGVRSPIAMLSAKKNLKVDKLKNSEIKAWIPKPFDPATLLNAVHKLVG